jgi:hypothetical protein
MPVERAFDLVGGVRGGVVQDEVQGSARVELTSGLRNASASSVSELVPSGAFLGVAWREGSVQLFDDLEPPQR